MPTAQPGLTTAGAPGLRTRVVDRVFDRVLGLPKPRNPYDVVTRIPITMDDGVVLLADHYRPIGAARGTVLVRTPYGRDFPADLLYGRVWAARGYDVLLQSCRGTADSGGEFDAMVREAADAQTTVAWLRGQSWFDGRLATLGGSYLGWNQWALLMDPPPELRACVVVVSSHDMAESAFGAGPFTLSDTVGWAYLMGHQGERGPLGGDLLLSLSITRKLTPKLASLPLGRAIEEALGGRSPWLHRWLAHPDRDDPFWAPYKLGPALQRVDVPVLLIGGWQDIFLRHTIEQYEALHARGLDVALTVGPWTHLDFVNKAGREVMRQTLGWLDEHVAGTGRRSVAAPVSLRLTGAGGRHDLPAWPPPARDEVWYLGGDGTLAAVPPPTDVAPSRFRYDPADPTPSYAGRRLTPDAGMKDNRRLEERPDVLTFTSPPLGSDADVVGRPVVELAHGTDNPYADVFVRLCDVDERGRSVNFSDGMVRLDPLVPAGSVTTSRIELDPCAHRLLAGHRLRLQVSGGAHPRFFRNTGTGEPPATAASLAASARTVHHGAGGVSLVRVPVMITQPTGGAAARGSV
jgi:putative CocE/NonD family hydrolase